MIRMMMVLAVGVPLAACQTTSFAPPNVNPQQRAYVSGAAGCEARVPAEGVASITPDVEGAIALTDNFILAYRCAERELADGRQFFQLPAFAAATVGLVGPTLGLGADGTLMAGTGAGLFNTGNSYYAPRAKLGMVTAATRALLCIKTEAVGVNYFQLVTEEQPTEGETVGAAQELSNMSSQLGALLNDLEETTRALEARRATDPSVEGQLRENREFERRVRKALVDSSVLAAAASADDTVYVSAERQYYEMVSAALFSVETILAERLRDAGSADTKGLFEELTKLAEQHAAAKKKLEEATDGKGEGEGEGTDGQGEQVVYSMADVPVEERPNIIELENDVLRPKLEICVLQARA